MAKVQADDKCTDCNHCKRWSTDHAKASCDMKKKPQGFHPDQNVPVECVGKMTRSY